MRRLGMGLPAIAEVLADEVDTGDGLRAHITALEEERDRIERQIRFHGAGVQLMQLQGKTHRIAQLSCKHCDSLIGQS